MNKQTEGWVYLAARVMLALLFIIAGVRKVLAFDGTIAYMTKFGVPMTELLLVATIVIEIGGGLMLVLGWKARYAAIALAVFTAIVTPIFHAYWTYEAAQYAGQLNNFYKNLAIIGGMIYVALHGAGPLSLDGRSRSS